jgi:hypothetical protein
MRGALTSVHAAVRFALRPTCAALAVACAFGVEACGGGGGPLVTVTSGGREDPGNTRDQPPDTRDEIGGNCLQCDVQYVCSPTANQTTIELSSSQGTCTQALIDLVCGGSLFGASSCSGGGGGAFTCGNVTCSPAQQSFPGGQGGTPSGGFADAG